MNRVIIDHIKQQIEVIDNGKYSGHAFMASFPQPYKKLLPYKDLSRLEMCCALLNKYGEKPINKSFYLNFLDKGTTPEGLGYNKLLLWNLYDVLIHLQKIVDDGE